MTYVCEADNEIHIESLKPSTKYKLWVSAKNEVGVGPHYELEIETLEPRKYGIVIVVVVLFWNPGRSCCSDVPYRFCMRDNGLSTFLRLGRHKHIWPNVLCDGRLGFWANFPTIKILYPLDLKTKGEIGPVEYSSDKGLIYCVLRSVRLLI